MTVHFIGAGPGAADLITLRAQRLIAGCPVCLYAGALVSDAVLAHAPVGARLVDTQHLDLDAIIAGEAPAVLGTLPAPDAVFVGDGVSAPGILDACWTALRAGGRVAANAVTLEGEGALVAARAAHGGELTRLEVAHGAPIGGFTGWRPQMPVVVWSARKP